VVTAVIGWTLEIGLDLIGLALGSLEYRGLLATVWNGVLWSSRQKQIADTALRIFLAPEIVWCRVACWPAEQTETVN